MKKRVWALLLAVVLAFSVLAGCAKQENTPADTKEPSNQTDPTPSGDDKTDAPAEASQDVFPWPRPTTSAPSRSATPAKSLTRP